MWTRESTDVCTGVNLSLVAIASVWLFVSQKESLAPLSPRGSVNECSLLYPGFETLGSGTRVKLRDMFADRQVRICLPLLDPCI